MLSFFKSVHGISAEHFGGMNGSDDQTGAHKKTSETAERVAQISSSGTVRGTAQPLDDYERYAMQSLASPLKQTMSPKRLPASRLDSPARARCNSHRRSSDTLLKDIVPGALVAVGEREIALERAKLLGKTVDKDGTHKPLEIRSRNGAATALNFDLVPKSVVSEVSRFRTLEIRQTDAMAATELSGVGNRTQHVCAHCGTAAVELRDPCSVETDDISEEIVRRFQFEFSNDGRCRQRIEMPNGPSSSVLSSPSQTEPPQPQGGVPTMSSPSPPPSIGSDKSRMVSGQVTVEKSTPPERFANLSISSGQSSQHYGTVICEVIQSNTAKPDSRIPLEQDTAETPMHTARSYQAPSTISAAVEDGADLPLKGQLFLDGQEIFWPDPAYHLTRCKCRRTRSVDPSLFEDGTAESIAHAVEVCVDCGQTKLFSF